MGEAPKRNRGHLGQDVPWDLWHKVTAQEPKENQELQRETGTARLQDCGVAGVSAWRQHPHVLLQVESGRELVLSQQGGCHHFVCAWGLYL